MANNRWIEMSFSPWYMLDLLYVFSWFYSQMHNTIELRKKQYYWNSLITHNDLTDKKTFISENTICVLDLVFQVLAIHLVLYTDNGKRPDVFFAVEKNWSCLKNVHTKKKRNAQNCVFNTCNILKFRNLEVAKRNYNKSPT